MIVIGEKLNGAIPSVAKAIGERDEAFIKLVLHQELEAGVDFIDVCAGTSQNEELEVLQWMINIIQNETDTPICVDSPDPNVLKTVLPLLKVEGLINSVSGEGQKCDIIFPLMRDNGWQVIALTCDDSGIPTTADKRVDIAVRLLEKAAEYEISPDRIHIDPLVMTLATFTESMLCFMETVQRVKEKYPTVKITSGLSNISFGMPVRKLINQSFLTLAMYAGMDSAIFDPTNRDLYGTVLATDVLLGRDKFCRNYNRAFRSGKIGSVK